MDGLDGWMDGWMDNDNGGQYGEEPSVNYDAL
jgi:hypothetical protein